MMLLFDKSPKRTKYNRETFRFLNASELDSMCRARATLDEWFSRVPVAKQPELRGDFRGRSSGSHLGGLLELTVNEILYRIGAQQLDPLPDTGLHPDCMVSIGDMPVAVECKMIDVPHMDPCNADMVISDLLHQINVEGYGISWECEKVPLRKKNMSTRSLRIKLRKWQHYLERDEVRELSATEDSFCTWDQAGYRVRFTASLLPDGMCKENGDDGKVRWMRSRNRVMKKLNFKAHVYHNIGMPTLIVLAVRDPLLDDAKMMDVLYGDALDDSRWNDGFWSPPGMNRPTNRHVSGVLFKTRFKDVWSICGRDTEWTMVHNPWAAAKLPCGIFPFAQEWRCPDEGAIAPTASLADIMGLEPDWPGMVGMDKTLAGQY